jgi:DNA-binding NarL/FixJ family response regulator
MSIRVLLVDDNPAFLETAARFLSVDPRIQVVGGVLAGAEALEQAGPLRADLVLMDLAMTGMNGLETTRHLKALEPPPLVIILTLHDNLEYRIAAELAQADGFVAKADFGAKLLPLIHHLFPDQKTNPLALEDRRVPTRAKEVLP